MGFPDFTDLRRIAAELTGNKEFDKLRKLIEQVWRVQSCITDLRQSADCCDALTTLLISPRQKQSASRATTENSLLMSGVMFYARATGTSGQLGERGSIKLDDKKLTTEQRIDHKNLLEIRNRAFAHVYRESPIASNLWHDDMVFAVDLADQGWKPAVSSSRISFHVLTFQRLLRQIPVADEFMTRIFHKRMNAMMVTMNDGSIPLEIFLRFRFDPIDKFHGVKAVELILAGIPVGHASFTTHGP